MAGQLPSLPTLIFITIEYLFYRFYRVFFGPGEIYERNISNKIVIVTGANSGLGKTTALELAKRGATVVMACRNLVEGKNAMDEIQKATGSKKLVLMKLDLEDFNSVTKFSKDFEKKFPCLNILINNAGICTNSDKLTITKDGYEQHFQVNYLGHFFLTNMLLSALRRGAPSRVVTVSSDLQMLEELELDDLNLKQSGVRSKYGSFSYKPYNNSKYANSLFMYEFSKKLDETSGVAAYTVCPGLCTTNIFRHLPWYRLMVQKLMLFLIGFSSEQGVESILYCALSKLCTSESGQVYHFSKQFPALNKKMQDNKDLATQLWLESEKMVHLHRRLH